MALPSHSGCLRGEIVLALELSELFSVDIPHQCDTRCPALFMITREGTGINLRQVFFVGKRNQFNRIEYGVMIRSRDPVLCPLNALCFYLLSRLDLNREAFPDLSDGDKWFTMKACPPAGNITQEMSYHAHYSAMLEVPRACDINSSSVTHIFRKSGARLELAGVSEDQIRRLGNWNNQAMEGAYLSAIPFSAIRGIAGFPPHDRSYFLPRALIVPPEELQK